MKARWLGTAVFLFLSLSGCSARQAVQVTVLPVPPRDSRWEIDQKDRIPLPLKDAGRKELADALTWGLNRNNKIDNVSAGSDPNAPRKYAPLFDLLSKAPKLQDLETPPYKQWFPGPMVKQVVDARDLATPRDHTPVALNDGTYWWVFYRDNQDQLTGVMVVKVNAFQVMSEKKR
jgi:hypothetical protein